nr:hypothetical protein [Microbacterium hydrocarbonoxydans]
MSDAHRADVRRRLRIAHPARDAGIDGTPLGAALDESGARFVASSGPLERRWLEALDQLSRCIRPLLDGVPVLNEGGVYRGCWIESTGTINTEVLGRFAPDIARDTLRQFAVHQRADGMIPYKVTDAGPGFSQIQIVTPLARVVWRHWQSTGDRELLRTMYAAMVRYDAWLAHYRNTRGTGGVEAFCAFDTGHDLSPRFWFAPDRALHGDARECDPLMPGVPFIAPDLTANVACQRSYLALIAAELGDDLEAERWGVAAETSLRALREHCFDEDDGFYYDNDRAGRHVRIESDVLARVLACEVGDAEFFTRSLRRYLMNTRKFLAHYGFTSLAMDDPRFDHDAGRNSWGGPVNFLALLRAPEAFERHGHVAELALTASAVLSAVAVAHRFPQCLDPWSGTAGYTEEYAPSILWLLDAIERYSGILVRPDKGIWFSGLAPTRLEHGAAADAVGYRRTVDGQAWELVADDEIVEVHRMGEFAFSFPRGWRVETDRAGVPSSVVGLAAGAVEGDLTLPAGGIRLTVTPNERIALRDLAVAERTTVEFVGPVFD